MVRWHWLYFVPLVCLVLAGCDALVRPGLPFRFRLQRPVTTEDFERGPYLLQISLEHSGQVLASGDEPLAKLTDKMLNNLHNPAPLARFGHSPASPR